MRAPGGSTAAGRRRLFRIPLGFLLAAAVLLTGASAPAASSQVPTPAIVTGAGAGGGSHVRGWTATAARLPEPDFMAYSTAAGGVRVASGDVDGDGTPEIVTGPGPSGDALVRVFDAASHEQSRELNAFDWSGGVFVASADLNGDGKAEVIAGADAGGGSDIQVYDGGSGRRLAWFTTTFAGYGVRVASGDVNGDGRAEIVAAPGPSGPARVELYAGDGGNACGCGNGAPFRTLRAFGTDVTSGVVVASADVNDDGRAEIVVGGVTSSGPQVKVLDAATGAALVSFFPYGTDFLGSLSVAAGDLDGDGRAEIVTAALTTGGSEIREFDGQGKPVGSFFSLDPSLGPGPSVAVADLDGDEHGEIVAGGGPSFGDQRVTEFDRKGQIQSGFLAYEPFFSGGVRVAAGNVRGDVAPEIVTAPGTGRAAEIEVFDLQGGRLASFLPFGELFQGGAFVAVGDLDGDRTSEIVVGEGEGGEPRVKVLDGSGRELGSFLAFEAGFRGGVRVAVGDLDGDGKGEIVAGAGPGGANRVKVMDAKGVVLSSYVPFDAQTTNGVFVAAGDLEGDGRGEIIVGTEPGSGPALVKVFDPRTGDTRFTQPVSGAAVGAHVATGDIDEDGKDEIIVGSGSGVGLGYVAHVSVFRSYLGPSFSFIPYTDFEGGTFVTAPARVGPALVPKGRTIRTVEGNRFAGVVATFSDSAGRDTATAFAASISWGDGGESFGTVQPVGRGEFRVLGAKTYRDTGVHHIVVTISEVRGRTVKARSTAGVRAAALVARGRSLTVEAGHAFTRVVATLTDGDRLTPASHFRVLLRWGDGARSSGQVVRSGPGSFRILGRHRYRRPGLYRVVILVSEVDGGAVTATSRIRATGR